MNFTSSPYRYFFVTLTALLLTVSAMSALTVNVTTPGTLHTLVTDTEAADLTVQGTVDAADLYWIGENMASLSTLDMSQAHIVAYSGSMLNGHVRYAAATVPAAAFAGTAIASVKLPEADTLTIAEAAFAGCAIRQLELNGNIARLGDGAFSSCPALCSVTLSPNATYGVSAFADCPTLETVNLNGISDVADGMFGSCTGLTTVNGAAKVTTIGAQSFRGCTALKQFEFGKELTIIGSSAFQGSALREADMSACASLQSVGEFAFANNDALTGVTFSEDCSADIARGAFFDCPSLEHVELPRTLTHLSDYMLKGAVAATVHGNLPTAIDSIGAYALKDNRSITELKLPQSLTYIADGAMEGMAGLVAIDGSELQSVPELGDGVWVGVDQPSVNMEVQPSVLDAFTCAPQWQNFTITAVDGNAHITADGTAANPDIKGVFISSNLYVTCHGADMETLTLHDTAGALLARSTPRSNAATINTSAFAARIYIVSVKLTDGRNAVLKIAR